MKHISLAIAVGFLAMMSTEPLHAICLADGEYEQALADVRQREQADGSEASEATGQAGAGQTETADVTKPASEPRSTN